MESFLCPGYNEPCTRRGFARKRNSPSVRQRLYIVPCVVQFNRLLVVTYIHTRVCINCMFVCVREGENNCTVCVCQCRVYPVHRRKWTVLCIFSV